MPYSKEDRRQWYLDNRNRLLAKCRADYAARPDIYKARVKATKLKVMRLQAANKAERQ